MEKFIYVMVCEDPTSIMTNTVNEFQDCALVVTHREGYSYGSNAACSWLSQNGAKGFKFINGLEDVFFSHLLKPLN